MANLSLVFDLLARDQASSTFRKVGDEGERAGKKLVGAAQGVDGVVGSLKTAGTFLAGTAIFASFTSLYSAAAESQRIGRLTESTIRATGGAAQISAGQVGDLAGAISAKTGVDDEAIQSGQNLLLTFKNVRNEVGAGNDIFTQASSVLVDMSTVLGTDASGSAIQLGKALNDPIKGISTLSRAGVQFTEDQKAQIKTLVESGDVLGAQKIILGELTAQFGGAAEAAATPLDKMRVSVGNIAEAVGGSLVPIVDSFATNGLVAIEGISAGFSDGETSADGFEGAMQDVGVALAQVADVGGAVVGAGQDVAGFLGNIPPEAQAAAGALGAVALLKGPVGDAFDTIALKSLYARDALSGAGGLTGVLGATKGAASGLLSVFGGPWGIALAGAAAGVAYVSSEMAEADSQTQAWTQTILSGSAAATDLNEAYLAQYGGDKPDWLQQQSELLGFTSSLEEAEANARELYEAMDPLAQAQQNVTFDTNRLVQAIDEFGENSPQAQQAAELLAASNERLAGRQEAVARATEQAETALAGAAPTAEMFADEMDGVAQNVSDAKKEVDNYKLSLDILTGASVSLIQVQGAYFDSLEFSGETLAGLEGAVADVNGQLNQQSEAGRFASDTLLGVRDSGNQLIATMVEQGQTSEQVRAQDAQLRESFVATAEEMGFSEEQALNLANQILGIPEERQVQIDADVAAASTDVVGFQEQVAGLVDGFVDVFANTAPAQQSLTDFVNQSRQITLTTTVAGSSARAASNNATFRQVENKASGGRIVGPGTGTSDSILGIDALTGVPTAWVSDSEYVTNALQYSRNPALVEAINAGLVPAGINPADLRYLAAGGMATLGSLTLPVGMDLSGAEAGVEAALVAASAAAASTGAAGSGTVGGGWQSIFNFVKARIPQARENSSFRPGDPGYHGRGKAIDFGFGSGPGGAGSAGLAAINRLLHDELGANLAELIYDGIGDDRPDLKNGRPLNYGASTNAQHRNHVHAAARRNGGPIGTILNPHIRDSGGPLLPGYTFNGLGRPEVVLPGYAAGGLVAEDGSTVGAGFYSQTAGATEATLLSSADRRIAAGQALTAEQTAAVARRTAAAAGADTPLRIEGELDLGNGLTGFIRGEIAGGIQQLDRILTGRRG